MKAETAYNVVQALSEKELQRLYAMMDRKAKPVCKTKKTTTVWTLEEVTEKLLATQFKTRR